MVQTARPTSDVSAGNWSTDAGVTTNIFQAIDEPVASDADYVQSDQPDADEYVVGLGALIEPGVNSGHTVRYRYQKDAAGGDTIDLDVIAQAPDGWDVHTEAHDDLPSTPTAGTFTLISAEVDEFRAHGGYGMPRIKMVRRKRSTVTTNLNLTYSGSLQADLRRPSTGGPFPVVLMLTFGGFQLSDRTDRATEAARLAAEEGFATLALTVRVAPADLSPAAQDDCAAAVAWIVANAATYNLDATKIAAMGGSGAGHLAAYLAGKSRLPSGDKARILCAVNGSGPMALDLMDDDGSTVAAVDACETFVGVPEAGNTAAWQAASPYYQIAADHAPLLTAHALSDDIAVAQSTRMHAALAAQGTEQRLIQPSGATHGWSLLVTATIWAEAMTWLHRYLG